MMTNFHMPRTTLLMMIDAFVGERWKRLYHAAIEHDTGSSASVTPCCWIAGRAEPCIPSPCTIDHADGAARAATAHTANGSYRTPCFMPVGTRGAIKYLSAADYEQLGAEIVLGNTYHLMLRPGAETVARVGRTGPIRRVARADVDRQRRVSGVLARTEGRRRRCLVPQHLRRIDASVHARDGRAHARAAGCRHPDGPRRVPTAAFAARRHQAGARTHQRVGCTGRRAAHRRADQALFGIVQGGVSESMRAESAQRTAELAFDGYGIGGLSVGETRAEMLPALAAAVAHLPVDRPRYLMGVGDPASLVEAVALGVDQFDCVMQTRLGRHGTALTSGGKLHVKNAAHALSDEPIDATCRCDVCARHSPWLHPAPLPGGRTDRVTSRQPAQHQLDTAADGPDAGRNRRRNVRRPAARGAGHLGMTGRPGPAVARLSRRSMHDRLATCTLGPHARSLDPRRRQ